MLISDILGIEKSGIASQVMINRALILAEILEIKYKFETSAYLNKDKFIEFTIKNKKKKLIIILINPSWFIYNIRKTDNGVYLFNRGEFFKLLDNLRGNNE